MTDTVLCPECHRPVHVLDSFTLQRSEGAVKFLRVQCEGPLSFLISVEETDHENPPLPVDPADNAMTA